MSSCSYEGYSRMSSYWCAEKKVMSICSYIGMLMHEQLLMRRKTITLMSSCSYRGTHAWAATNVPKKWHSWTADHRGEVFTHEQPLLCRENMTFMSSCSYIYIYTCIYIYICIKGYSCMSSYSCAEKQITLMSSCSYTGVLMHEQLLMCRKKWHSWAASHVQKKMTLMSNCSNIGVLMHEQLLMCRKKITLMSSYTCAKKNDTHEQLLKYRGTHAHEQLLMCRRKNGHEQLLM